MFQKILGKFHVPPAIDTDKGSEVMIDNRKKDEYSKKALRMLPDGDHYTLLWEYLNLQGRTSKQE
jgi:hypothetical protein